MNRWILLIATALAVGGEDWARGQASMHSYGDFYRHQVPKTPNMINTNAYLYNKYFYHSPSVSPYANLARRDTSRGDAYSTWVRPEIERRQRAAQTARMAPPRNGAQNNYGLAMGGQPGKRPKQRTTSSYYNQYYKKPVRR